MNHTRGPGWLLVAIEHMMAEWGYSLEKALFEGPLNAVLTLWPAMQHRHGAEVHSTSADKARQAAKAAKRAEIEAAFTIVPASAAEMAAFLRGGQPRKRRPTS